MTSKRFVKDGTTQRLMVTTDSEKVMTIWL